MDVIAAIEFDRYYTTNNGEAYRRYAINTEYPEGKCVEISKTEEGSYLILFDDGKTYEIFKPSSIYRVPETHEILKK